MRRRVDAIRIEEPAMQLKPIAAGDGYRLFRFRKTIARPLWPRLGSSFPRDPERSAPDGKWMLPLRVDGKAEQHMC